MTDGRPQSDAAFTSFKVNQRSTTTQQVTTQRVVADSVNAGYLNAEGFRLTGADPGTEYGKVLTLDILGDGKWQSPQYPTYDQFFAQTGSEYVTSPAGASFSFRGVSYQDAVVSIDVTFGATSEIASGGVLMANVSPHDRLFTYTPLTDTNFLLLNSDGTTTSATMRGVDVVESGSIVINEAMPAGTSATAHLGFVRSTT